MSSLLSSDQYIVFYDLPKGASVKSVSRDNYGTITLIPTEYTNVFDLSSNDYNALRHNSDETIHVTYTINDQEYKVEYDEAFGFVG